MESRRLKAWGLLTALAALLLVGCDEEPPEQAERIRAIKPYYVVEPAGGDVRNYSGVVVAAVNSSLSFATGGTVLSVDVNQGDRVVQGQTLATLDPQQLEYSVEAAEAELAAAQAEFNRQGAELTRQRELYERGWVAQAAYQQALTVYESARSQLDLARSRLASAENSLSDAVLVAPFDGVISVRNIEPFLEVGQGQTVFEINAEDAYEVELSVPDAVVSRIAAGTPVAIDASVLPDCGCVGHISEVGTSAATANAVPVVASVLSRPEGLLPGMAVDVSIVLADADAPQGYLAPLVAIAPGDDAAEGYVFKFDAAAGVVRRTPIRSGGGVSGNMITVAEGLSAGDIIAAAGVSFLRDGQQVSLLQE